MEINLTDVLIIGGGPGGSTFATLMQDKGWDVTLIGYSSLSVRSASRNLVPTLPLPTAATTKKPFISRMR
jgi:pyruvate/2-oxoglutarate dehydrogenase complex dihydrolipoamide dehydrogenase (E3) component